MAPSKRREVRRAIANDGVLCFPDPLLLCFRCVGLLLKTRASSISNPRLVVVSNECLVVKECSGGRNASWRSWLERHERKEGSPGPGGIDGQIGNKFYFGWGCL